MKKRITQVSRKRQREPKNTECKGELLFYCSSCTKKFKTAQGYTKHQQKQHGAPATQAKKLPRRKRATPKKQALLPPPPRVADTECKICLDALAQPAGVAIPCGHGGFCYECINIPHAAGTLTTCPLCRSPIESVNKLYI